MSKVLAYVDDSPDDLFLFKSACRMAGVQLQPILIEGGSEGLEYLEHRGRYADRHEFPDPDVVLLDVKMPQVNGFEILQHLRSQAERADCPVGLLTSSSQPADIERARQLGATWYFLKPPNLNGLIEFVRAVDECLSNPDSGRAQVERLSQIE